jgi:hypothetical protein
VHEFVTARLNQVEQWPMPGSPDWCELDDDDPAKLAAVLDAGQHMALRIEICQQAQADAAKDVAAAADWPAIAHEIRDRTDFYTAKPWLKRAAS